MRLFFKLIGLLLLVCGLAGCAAQSAALPVITVTAPPPTATSTSTIAPSRTPTWTPTWTPSPTPSPTKTATVRPTETPPPEPTAVLTPIPIGPPAPDGVARTADVPILMYHYISAAPSANDRIRYGLSVSPEMFDAQLQLLRDNGFTAITLRDLYNYLAIGTPLPDKPIVLTFDDGYLDNYTNAFPILQKHGMIGTFFVMTAPADEGNPAYLSWDMIQAMSNAGMDIQLHARAHLDMRNRSYEWLVFHVIGGRQSIEGHTGKPVNFIAYPSGRYDANLQRFLHNTNFWAALTTANGRRHVLSEALAWDRIRISGQLRLTDFARLLNMQPSPRLVTPASSATPSLQSTGVSPVGQMLSPTPTSPVPTINPGTPPPWLGTPTPPASPLITPSATPTAVQSPLATPSF